MILIIRSAFSIRLHLSNRHVESWSDKLYSLIWVSPVSQHVARTILSSHTKAQLTNIFNKISKLLYYKGNLSADPHFNKKYDLSNMTSQHVLYHNEIEVILPGRFIKAGRGWCGDVLETWELHVTIGLLLALRDIPSISPLFKSAWQNIFINSKWSEIVTKFYTIFRPRVASKINVSFIFGPLNEIKFRQSWIQTLD